jgi:hypothetical protein
LTLAQLMLLFEHAAERKVRDLKFNAVLHGADPKDLEDKDYEVIERKENLLFGDPAEYAQMSEEEREQLTEKMEGKFKKWAGKTTLAPDRKR